MKKRTLTVLVVALVCTFLTACSKEIDTMTESVNEKESSVIENSLYRARLISDQDGIVSIVNKSLLCNTSLLLILM